MSERKHGHWKIFGHAATCSECGMVCEDRREHYCMRCGAVMDGEPTIDTPEIKLPRLVTMRCSCGCERIVSASWTTLFCPDCGAELRLETV